jgi:hypothetical protein
VEQVRRLVPVDPHAAEIIAEQVVERIAREEAQAVRNPVGLISGIVKVRLRALPEVADGLGALLISTRPDAQRDPVESVARVLLQDVGVVNAVRLASARANLNVMGEASLSTSDRKLRGDANLPSSPHGASVQSRCPAPGGGCCPESPGARTGPRRPSCVQSCPAEAEERAPTGTALCPRRTPCRHASGSLALAAQA